MTFSLVRLFHGSCSENVNGIDKEGLLPSIRGRLGQGIYLTVKNVAVAIAKARCRGEGTYIVEVEVDVGTMKDLEYEHDVNTTWSREGYDSCYGIHGPWRNVYEHDFPEWCIADPENCTVKGHWVVGGTVVMTGKHNAPVYVEDANVHIKDPMPGHLNIKTKNGFTEFTHYPPSSEDEDEMSN